jgi:hypothetical protein
MVDDWEGRPPARGGSGVPARHHGPQPRRRDGRCASADNAPGLFPSRACAEAVARETAVN